MGDYEAIDNVVTAFQDKDGMIIDIRDNGGGSDANAELIASRFADKKRLYRYVRYRSGENHTDFTEWRSSFIAPDGNSFTKPIAVLTNRGCFSSTESFLFAMKVMPQVVTVGGVTGGGSGSPIYRELPIGWTFRLSSWQEVDSDFQFIEGTGMTPDHLVTISEADDVANTDTILEAAIALLESN